MAIVATGLRGGAAVRGDRGEKAFIPQAPHLYTVGAPPTLIRNVARVRMTEPYDVSGATILAAHRGSVQCR